MRTILKLRRDLQNNWELYNPLIEEGELIYVKNKTKLLIGAGDNFLNNILDIWKNFEEPTIIKNVSTLNIIDLNKQYLIVNCGSSISLNIIATAGDGDFIVIINPEAISVTINTTVEGNNPFVTDSKRFELVFVSDIDEWNFYELNKIRL